MDVRVTMLVFQDLESLTEVFDRMSTGMSVQKLPVWPDFSFFTLVLEFFLSFALIAFPPFQAGSPKPAISQARNVRAHLTSLAGVLRELK